jgi:hypothetical protein
MSQLNVVSYLVVINNLFFMFFLTLIIIDLFQLWIFGVFRFGDLQIIYFRYLNLTLLHQKGIKIVNLKQTGDSKEYQPLLAIY